MRGQCAARCVKTIGLGVNREHIRSAHSVEVKSAAIQPRVHRIGKCPDADQKRARPSTRRADCKSPEQSIGVLLFPENISMSEQPSSVRFSGIAVSYARHALFAKSAARPAQRQLRLGTANARTRLNRQPLVRKIEKRPAPEQRIETLSMSAKKQYVQSNFSQRKGTPLGLRPHIRFSPARGVQMPPGKASTRSRCP